MFKFLVLAALLLLSSGSFVLSAQTCAYRNLSKKFDYIVTAVKTEDETGSPGVAKISVEIFKKADKKAIQRISINSEHLFESAYTDCAAVKSYSTGKNKNLEVSDNDYGDFIVADFNFDGADDFAVKEDSGGNGGAFYVYYTQNRNGTFTEDKFLTGKVGYFPGTIDAKTKTLVTYVHANAAGYNETVYKFNPLTGKWRRIKSLYRKAG